MQFSEILSPLSLGNFTSSIFGNRIFHLPGASDKFTSLISWEDIDSILSNSLLTSQRIKIYQKGALVPWSRYAMEVPRYPDVKNSSSFKTRLDLNSIKRLMDDGASLVINQIDELSDTVGELATGIAREIGEEVYVNAYLSRGTDPGFNMHWDDHEVIVLQVSGHKHWTIHPPTLKNPLRFGPQPMQSDLTDENKIDLLLSQGDFLHLPRGWWHLVTPINEPSLHLTIGLTRRNGVHFIHWLADRLGEEEEIRRNIPLDDESKKYTQILKEVLSRQEENGDLVAEFLHEHRKRILSTYRENSDAWRVSGNSE
ncbi:JmjC domain-containing protein [Streptomyces cinereoruber]|uniref:JmjC domain-containing protein n=1 Tax=Streptomyces cinereoruber TaxID=67260 RepID=UPI00362E6A80